MQKCLKIIFIKSKNECLEIIFQNEILLIKCVCVCVWKHFKQNKKKYVLYGKI